ncbi:MAG: hypothetical protein J6U17_03875 [Kiritimatiellae bacterium]|nr:hypothetical protein [Kiritimatiellia bacterium]
MTNEKKNRRLTAFVTLLAAACAASASAATLTRARPGVLGRPSAAATTAAPVEAEAKAEASAASEASAPSDLNFKDAPVDMVLEVFGRLVDRTVLKDPGVSASSTITLKSLPGQKLSRDEQIEALRSVLEMNGVHMEDYGEKFVRALPRKDVRKEGIPMFMDGSDPELEAISDGQVVSVNIPFKNIPVDEAQKAIEGFKSNNGLLQVFERINSIVVTDTKLNIARMRELAEKIDVARVVDEQVKTIQVKYASAEEIKTVLQSIVDDAMKYQEQEAKARAGAQNQSRSSGASASAQSPARPGGLLTRPGAQQQPAQPTTATSVDPIFAGISDADRGVIRGRVQIIAEPRTNKLIITTNEANHKFFQSVIDALDIPTTPDTKVVVRRLKYAEAEDVASMINDLIGNTSAAKDSSKQNQNQNARNGTNSNLSRGTTANSSQQRGNASSANQRSGEGRTGELTKDNTTILADKRMNAVVVMTLKDLIPTVDAIIEALDVKLSQVLIETCIIEVTLGDGLQTGIDWVQRGKTQGITGYTEQQVATGETDDDGNPTYTTQTTPVYGTVRGGFVNRNSYALAGGGGTASGMLNLMMNAATNAVIGAANPIGGGLTYLLSSKRLNISAIIQATKDDSRAKYLAAPIVMTQDNKEATIDATEKRKFFSGYETSSSTYNYVRTPKYDSDDIGIKIKVKPKINPNGTVMLNVEEEYTQLGAGQNIIVDDGNGGQGTAYIDTALKRKMTSDVLLENMQTVVLGGLTEKFMSESETGIPILKDIPWIGKWLFGSVKRTENRKELLVFMTPYVIDDAETAHRMAERLKNALSDARPWDDNGWSASKLADPVPQKEALRRLKDTAKKQDEDRKTKLAVEAWKLERAKSLEGQDAQERDFWIKKRREELKKGERKSFDEEVSSRMDLDGLAAEIRAQELAAAEAKIEASEAGKFSSQPLPAPAPEDEEEPAQEPAAPLPAPEASDVLDDLVSESAQ